MSGIRVSLLGRFAFEIEDTRLLKIESLKAQELLCYLLLFRQRPHTREVIAETLWAKNRTTQAKSYLRRTIWQLQSALESETLLIDIPLLLIESVWLRINPECVFGLDVAILEDAYASVEGIPGQKLNIDMANRLHAATKLYQGNLLEGWYQNWCVFERERLLHIYLILLDKLIQYCEAHNLYEEGINYGLSILRQDMAREQTHRQLMRLRCYLRDRCGALRQYKRCVTALQDELGVEPTNRTQILYQQIKCGSLDMAVDKSQQRVLAEGADRSSLQEAHLELKQIRDEIALLNARVDHVIQATETFLAAS